MDSSLKPSIPAKIVFLSRVDTFFGKILAQHLGQISLDEKGQRTPPVERGAMLDMDFMESAGRTGTLKVFGTWLPEEPISPCQPVKKHPRLPAIQGICPADSYVDIAKMITAADICIFNLVDDDSMNDVLESTAKALRIAGDVVASHKTPKTLVLVSTVMTWAKTKPNTRKSQNNEPPEKFIIAEEEFRRRKPHPHFRAHFDLEKAFLKMGYNCEFLNTTIVSAGVIYGMGENVLHPMFRDAWLGRTVKVIGEGKNIIPCIHARDLCQIVEYACLNNPRNRYILAVDESNIPLESIAMELSKILSKGEIEYSNPDEVQLRGEIPVRVLDLLACDLRLESSTIRDVISMDWVARSGCIDSMPRIVEEYKAFRHLSPIRIVITGPPFSGKSTLAKQLAQDYRIPVVSAQEIRQEAVAELVRKMEILKTSAADADKQSLMDIQMLLDTISKDAESNNGEVSDTIINRFVREKLTSVECRNQGYVLDGYPPSYASARELFGRPQNGNEGSGGETPGLPEFVFHLDAPVDHLKQRILGNEKCPPENYIASRFAEYSLINTDDDSVLVYFAETDIPIHSLDVTQDTTSSMEKCLRAIEQKLGPPPHLYLITPEESRKERQEMLRSAAEKLITDRMKMAKPKEFQKKVAEAKYKQRFEQWQAELADADKNNEKLNEAAIPMRRYLMRYVLPVLFDGIKECEKVRPDDPVDYLAEYLLEHSRPLYADDRPVPFVEMTKKAVKQKAKLKAAQKDVPVRPAESLERVVTLEYDEKIYRQLYGPTERVSGPS